MGFPDVCHPERSFSPQAECGVKDLYAGTLEKLYGRLQILHLASFR
jgi:hypothetical protein